MIDTWSKFRFDTCPFLWFFGGQTDEFGSNWICLIILMQMTGKTNLNFKLKSISQKIWPVSFFDPFFATRPQMGCIARMDPKPTSSCWYMLRPSPPTHKSKSCFKIEGLEPPLNKQSESYFILICTN